HGSYGLLLESQLYSLKWYEIQCLVCFNIKNFKIFNLFQGAIVTGRWIYLSSSSFDEVVFYITFTVCLGFATIYFRRGTKYHNAYDLLFLLLTVPLMW